MQIQSYNGGSSAKTTKAESRCPHGASPGSCPACSGGGGGGGKKAGLMSWNEAYAVWNALRVAETRKQDYLQGAAFRQEQRQQETQFRTIRNLAQVVWGSWLRSVPPGLLELGPNLANAFKNGLGWLTNGPRNLGAIIQQRFSEGIRQPIIDISDKLAAMLGDARKRLEEILHHNEEMLKSLLAQLQWEERLGQVQSLMGRMLQSFGPRQVFRGIERRVKSLFEKIRGLFEQAPDEDEPSPKNWFR